MRSERWRKLLRWTLSALLVTASLSSLVTDSRGVRPPSFGYDLAQAAFLLGAFLSLVLVFVGDTWREAKPAGRGAMFLPAFAALACVAAVIVRYRGIPVYATVASIFIGAGFLASAFAMLDSDPLPEVSGLRFRLDSVWVLLAGATIALRVLAPGSPLLTWCLAPLFVMVMAGWSLGGALLPPSTGFLERLFWAPVFSLSVLVVTLMWLDMAGVVVSPPTIFLLAIAFTLAGSAIARLR